MGMFDEVRCDYPISPEVNGKICQTKDINGDIGGLGNFYYIDPSGQLFYIDYYGTSEWVRDPTKSKPYPYVRIQTGKHGRVKALKHNRIFTITPPFQGRWQDTPFYQLSIVDGRVESYKKTNTPTYEHRHHRDYSF